ncbi:MAG: Smr/MutS family protein [Acidobacteria bacterium]|jgi:DNA-nicking Smr family endonuclease|nr:Smr/MutS family protein [Acidobacteriota bacterium]
MDKMKTSSAIKNKKKPGKIKVDKKGIPIINENNLDELFLAGSSENKKSKEQFKHLFEKSQLDIYQRIMLMEKKKISEELKTSPILAEQLKNYPAPEKELDLHGLSREKAALRTESFIRTARCLDIMTIRVIVGKGIHSEGKAILPDVVEAKIIELKRRSWVLYYKWEKKVKSKSGSLVVYLTPDPRLINHF